MSSRTGSARELRPRLTVVPRDELVQDLGAVRVDLSGRLLEPIPPPLGHAGTRDEGMSSWRSRHKPDGIRPVDLFATSQGSGHGVSVATKTAATKGCVWLHKGITCSYTNEARQGNTNPRQLGGTSGISDNRDRRKSAVTTSLAVATAKSTTGIAPAVCDAHHAPVTFAIEFDDLDGDGRRETYCHDCIGDGIDYTMGCVWFAPPVISRIPAPLTWSCARCGEDPKTCPVVNGRCVREQVAV